MLRSNSNKFREKVQNFIIANSDFEGYDMGYYGFEDTPKKLNEICYALLCIAESEVDKFHSDYAMLEYWMRGLPSAFCCDDFLLKSATDLLADWYEETETEKSKFAEEQAEQRIIYLISAEIIKNAERN